MSGSFSAPPRETGSPLADRLFEPGGATLEGLISDAWDELTVAGRTECPVCSATMGLAGGCPDCGSELS